ncbi:MAG: PfkB family carbohydrate kinase, partial [Actinomycetota bacterium]
AVDTTGAGDTFCGALAAALADGRAFADAASFATAAAALSVQRVGAVPSIPSRAEIDALF